MIRCDTCAALARTAEIETAYNSGARLREAKPSR